MNNMDKLIKDNTIPFRSNKIINGSVIWRCESYGRLSGVNELYENYAFVVPESPCFSEVGFSEDDFCEMYAEPYGGAGVGANGGGGRCGNIGGRQVKGVGINPLVGDHDNEEHAYGGLDIRKATIETVYSVVLENLLPKGVVKVRGLIFIGKDTARSGSQKVWGGLMVRDQCIRPGHFLRSPYFKPRSEAKSRVKSDLARIRLLYKEMALEAGENHSRFIKWLGAYLRNVASQFAFARVMRITHGTMTASNISWDGKWLDLPACSFLTGGVNYNIWSQFYEEHNMALGYAMEILHNYSKYNKVALNASPLVSYFYEQFQEYGKYYVGYILGLEIECVLKLPENSWSQVSETFLRVIHSGKRVEPKRPSYDPHDPVITLTAAFFMACSGSSAFVDHARQAGLSDREAERFKKSSVEVWDAYINIKNMGNQRNGRFLLKSFLIAMKRALLPEIWYLPNVEGQVTRICTEGSPDEIGPYIDKHKEVSSWVFENGDNEVVLFKEAGQSAHYLVDEGKFAFFDGDHVRRFECYDRFNADVLRNLIVVEPVIYDFSLFFDRLGYWINDLNENGLMSEVAREEYV